MRNGKGKSGRGRDAIGGAFTARDLLRRHGARRYAGPGWSRQGFPGREEVLPESVADRDEFYLQGGKLGFAERLFDAPADPVLAGNLPVPHAGRRNEDDDVGVDKRIEPGVLQRL